MPRQIRDFIENLTMVDAHGHHFPRVLDASDIEFLCLFTKSYASWPRGRLFCFLSDALFSKPVGLPRFPITWVALAPCLAESGSNSFARNLVRVV